MVRVGIALPFVFTAVFAANCTDEPTRPRVPLKPSAQVAAAASRIAFSSNRDGSYQIYVMDADGSAATRLTSLPGQNSEPSWAPDGRHIAFVSSQDGHSEIYVMNADGSAQTKLTSDPADYTPRWSPDGLHIAFGCNRGGGNLDICGMAPDGSAETALTSAAGSNSQPSWSPDAQQIAFTSTRDGNSEIYVI